MSNGRKLANLIVGTNFKVTNVDSDLANTISSIKTRLDSDTAIAAGLLNLADSDLIISQLEAKISSAVSNVDSDSLAIQAANTQIEIIKARLDSDSIKLQSISIGVAAEIAATNNHITDIKSRLDSDDTKLQSLDTTISGLVSRLDSDEIAIQAGKTLVNSATAIAGMADSDLKVVADLRNQLDSEILSARSLHLSYTNYNYNATAGQTTFTGSDANSLTLAYIPNAIQVFLNGILLEAADYTATNGTSIVLTEGAQASAQLTIIVAKAKSSPAPVIPLIPNWSTSSHLQFIPSPIGGQTNFFGASVDISDDGNFVIAGAPFEDANYNNGGAAYIFGGDGISTSITGIGNSYYDNISSGSLTTYDTNPENIAFNSDGTRMYLVGRTSQTIYQFDLSSPYDITAAARTYNNVSFYTGGGVLLNEVPAAIRWNNDGTKLLCFDSHYKKVFEYNLSTAYDLSTASYNNVNFYFGATVTGTPQGFGFNGDGTQLFVGVISAVYVFDLSTGFDMNSTITYNYTATFANIGVTVYFGNLIFNSSGFKAFFFDYGIKGMREYHLTTPYDLSSGVTYIYAMGFDSYLYPAGNVFKSMTFNGDMSKVFAPSVDSNFVIPSPGYDIIHQFSTDGAQPYYLQQRIQPSVYTDGSYQGQSVSMSGDGYTAAVGWPDRKHATYDTPGCVRIWTRSGTTWSQQTEIFASDATNSHKFGQSVSLSEDGATLAVGASQGNRVYIYTRSGTTWTEQKKILDGVDHTISHQIGNGWYGESVDLTSDGNNLVIGSPSYDYGGNAQGSAYVYTRSGTTWSYQATIIPSSRGIRDGFGWSVSIARGDGNTIAIGHKYENANYAGYAWIFTRSGTTWSAESNFRHSTSVNADHFGRSVALSSDGNLLFAGAPNDKHGVNTGATVGRAFIFKRTGSTWAVETPIEFSGGNNASNFGFAVAISSNGAKAIGGNPQHGGQSNNSLDGYGAIDIYSAPLS